MWAPAYFSSRLGTRSSFWWPGLVPKMPALGVQLKPLTGLRRSFPCLVSCLSDQESWLGGGNRLCGHPSPYPQTCTGTLLGHSSHPPSSLWGCPASHTQESVICLFQAPAGQWHMEWVLNNWIWSPWPLKAEQPYRRTLNKHSSKPHCRPHSIPMR